MFVTRLLLTVLLLASACRADAQAAPIHVMRHLDTPAGVPDPDLTEQGRRNAARLDAWFKGKPLAAIYVTDFKRTRQTVAPLAARLGLSPKTYDPRDTPGLVAALRRERGPVLVVGHSNTVPDIVEQAGGARPAPLSHPDFGDLWIVRDGTTELVDLER